MITRLLMDFLAALVSFVVGLFPTTNPPGWVSNTEGLVADLFNGAAGLGNWIPWALVGTVFGTVMACVVIGFTIKVVRIVASFLTAGGGSAA